MKMLHYIREDGVQAEAVKFEGRKEGEGDDILDFIQLFHQPGFNSTWHPEKDLDEWAEDEETGEPYQLSEPEHIETINDRLYVGDYVVISEGVTYVMAGELFESIWTNLLTDEFEKWSWQPAKRLKYAKTVGYWKHRDDEDAVSTDGGVTYFRLSEREPHQAHGTIYTSVKVED